MGGSPEMAPVKGFVHRADVSRLPRLFGVLGNGVDLIKPQPRQPFFMRGFERRVPECVIGRRIHPKLAN